MTTPERSPSRTPIEQVTDYLREFAKAHPDLSNEECLGYAAEVFQDDVQRAQVARAARIELALPRPSESGDSTP